MDYNDLKLIWDEQAERPLFTIDHEALLSSVEEKCNAIDKSLKWNERIIIPACLFSGSALSLQLFISREPSWISFGVGIIMLLEALYTWILLRTRKQGERAYEEAVVPSLEKAIFQSEHLATLLKNWLIFFHIPAGILGIAALLFFPEGRTAWMWGVFVLMVAYSIWDTPRYLRHTYRAEQKNLHAIRTRLLEADKQ